MKLWQSSKTSGAAQRIKTWAIERFGAGEEAWFVTETLCTQTGAPQRQTLIVLFHPAASIAFRIARPIDQVEWGDVTALGEAAASLAEACC